MKNKYNRIAKYIDSHFPKYKYYNLSNSFTDADIEVMELLQKKKNVLTENEIKGFYANNKDNMVICHMLLECKNIPTDVMMAVYKSIPTAEFYRDYRGEVIPFWSANIPKEKVEENVELLLRQFATYPNIENRNVLCNEVIAFECAKKTFYEQDYPDDEAIRNKNYYFLQKISFGKQVDEKEFNEELTNMMETIDVPYYDAKVNTLLSNPNFNDKIIADIYNNDDFDMSVANMFTYCPASKINEVYDYFVESMFEDKDKRFTFRDLNIVEEMLFNPNMTGGMINDLINRLCSEDRFSYMLSRVAYQMLWNGRGRAEKAKDFPEEAWFSIFEHSNGNVRKYILQSDSVSPEFKKKCCEYYFDKVKRKKFVRSNTSMINALTAMVPYATLPEERYEQLEEKLRRTEYLREECKCTPNTPLKYLEIYLKEDPYNLETQISIFCNQNGLSHKAKDAIYHAMNRNFKGNKSKMRINIQIVEDVLNTVGDKMPELIEYFENYAQEKSKFTKKVTADERFYANNVKQFIDIYKSIQEYDNNMDEFLKYNRTKFYFEEKQDEIAKKIINDEKGVGFFELLDNFKKYEEEFFALDKEKKQILKEAKGKENDEIEVER